MRDIPTAVATALNGPSRKPVVYGSIQVGMGTAVYVSASPIGLADGFPPCLPVVESWGEIQTASMSLFRQAGVTGAPVARLVLIRAEASEALINSIIEAGAGATTVRIWQSAMDLPPDPGNSVLLGVFTAQDPIVVDESNLQFSLDLVHKLISKNPYLSTGTADGNRYPYVVGKKAGLPLIDLKTGPTTELTTNISRTGDPTIKVRNAEGFPLAGALVIDDETFVYNSRTSDTFITASRSGGNRQHSAGNLVALQGAVYQYAVSSGPVASVGNVMADGLPYPNPYTTTPGGNPCTVSFADKPPWTGTEIIETDPITFDPVTVSKRPSTGGTVYDSSTYVTTYPQIEGFTAVLKDIGGGRHEKTQYFFAENDPQFKNVCDGVGDTTPEIGYIGKRVFADVCYNEDGTPSGYPPANDSESAWLSFPDGNDIYFDDSNGGSTLEISYGDVYAQNCEVTFTLNIKYYDAVNDVWQSDEIDSETIDATAGVQVKSKLDKKYIEYSLDALPSGTSSDSSLNRKIWLEMKLTTGTVNAAQPCNAEFNITTARATSVRMLPPVAGYDAETGYYKNRCHHDLSALGTFVSLQAEVSAHVTDWYPYGTEYAADINGEAVDTGGFVDKIIDMPSVTSWADMGTSAAEITRTLTVTGPQEPDAIWHATLTLDKLRWLITYQPPDAATPDEHRTIYADGLTAEATSLLGADVTPPALAQSLITQAGISSSVIDLTNFAAEAAKYATAEYVYNGFFDADTRYLDALRACLRESMSYLDYNGEVKWVPYRFFTATPETYYQIPADHVIIRSKRLEAHNNADMVSHTYLEYDVSVDGQTIGGAVEDQVPVLSEVEYRAALQLIYKQTVAQTLSDNLLGNFAAPKPVLKLRVMLPSGLALERGDGIIVDGLNGSGKQLSGVVIDSARSFEQGKTKKINWFEVMLVNIQAVRYVEIAEAVNVSETVSESVQ